MLSRLLTRKEQAVLVAFAASVCVGAAALYMHGQGALPAVEETSAAASALFAAQVEQLDAPAAAQSVETRPLLDAPLEVIAVAVEGAVRRPGVYRMLPEARVQDLIDMAGGPTDLADLEDVNRAAPLVDGTTLSVPLRAEARVDDGKLVLRRHASAADLNLPAYTISGSRRALAHPAPPTPAPASAAATADPGDGRVDLNRATLEELQALPGIGPALAGRIVAYRALAPFQTVDDLLHVSGIGPKRLEAIRPLAIVQP